MKQILVSGSIAYDNIMNYPGTFTWAVNTDSSWNINASMLIDDLKKEMWWTWLNIAFNLAMLWEDWILLWAIWEDFVFDEIVKERINFTYIHKSRTLLSARAYIINDNAGWQINTFYPGALEEAWKVSVSDIREEISHFMVSPNKKEAMLKHLDEWKKFNLKTFFDPGQMLETFSKEELEFWTEKATYFIGNEIEFSNFMKKIEKDEIELLESFEKIIVTLGSEWSKIIDRSWVIHINPVVTWEVIDPTWAWDAFRAWLLKWLKHWFDFETSAKMWSIASSYCIQFKGWQNHFVNTGLIIEWMKDNYWIEIKL